VSDCTERVGRTVTGAGSIGIDADGTVASRSPAQAVTAGTVIDAAFHPAWYREAAVSVSAGSSTVVSCPSDRRVTNRDSDERFSTVSVSSMAWPSFAASGSRRRVRSMESGDPDATVSDSAVGAV
jgi:hypothetical protein